MRKKWLPVFFAVVTALCCSFGIAACKKKTPVDQPLQLNAAEQTIAVYDTFVLTADTTESLTFTSSATDVATVSADGVVTALKVGSTVVTVAAGARQATCAVTVTTATEVPVLKASTESIDLISGANYTLTAAVRYKGVDYTDAQLTFASSDTAVATVAADGKVAAVSNGEATVTVTGKWRGAGADLLSLEIPVTVRADVVIEFDYTATTLATVDMTDAGGASDSLDLDVSVKADGEAVEDFSFELDPDGDTDVIGFDGNTVRALKVGKTALRVVAEYDNETYRSLWKEITVEYAVFDRTEDLSLEFLLTDDQITLDTNAVLGQDAPEVTAVRDVEANAVLGSSATLDKSKLISGLRTYRVETEKYAVQFAAEVITQRIMNKTDLDNMLNLAAVEGTHDEFDGYFVLGANIDYGGDEYSYGSDATRILTRYNGWKGVFDGKGYAIYDLTVTDMAGVFGYVAYDGVIKNVAFENVRYKQKSHTYGQTQSWGVMLFGQHFYGTLENVLITVGSFEGTGRIIADEIGNAHHENSIARLKNVVVDATDFFDNGYSYVLCSYGASVMNNVSVITTSTSTTDVDSKNRVTGTNTGKPTRYATMGAFMDAAASIEFDDVWLTSGERVSLTGFAALVKEEMINIETEVSLLNGLSVSVVPTSLRPYVSGTVAGGDGKVTYENGMISVAADLTADTTCTLTLQSKLNSQDKVTVTVIADYKDLVELTTRVDYETYNNNTADQTVAIDGLQGNLVSVKIDGADTTVQAVINGTNVVLSGLADLENGDHTLTVETTESFYRMPLLIATKVIRTADDFKNVLVYGNTGKNVYGGYVVLGNDIDYGGATYDWENVKNDKITADWPNKDTGGWKGTFDGRGHTVYNINIKRYCGIFLAITSGGVVKNVGFANVGLDGTGAGTATSASVLAGYSYGTVENVFIEITSINCANNHAALYDNHYAGAIARNVVVYTKNSNTAKDTAGALTSDNLSGSAENVFVVTDFVNIYKNLSFETGYPGITKIDGTSDLTAEQRSALGDYWTFDHGVPMFKTAVDHVGAISIGA